MQQLLKIAPGADFWSDTAHALIDALSQLPQLHFPSFAAASGNDWSSLRIVVPTFEHAAQLRLALHHALGVKAFIAPRIVTMTAWLDLQPPGYRPDNESGALIATESERLMQLYAELRQHAWLKKLFTARRNTDLLPLAQTLLSLADELTAALLPGMTQHPQYAEERWEAALAQLPPFARSALSEEAQLVWTIWKSQLTAEDPGVASLKKMMTLAASARSPLIWIAPAATNACTDAFLHAWATHQPVLRVTIDWRSQCLASTLVKAWPELIATPETSLATPVKTLSAVPAAVPAEVLTAISPALPDATALLPSTLALLSHVSLSPATSLEDEAACGAQTIVDWLDQGKTAIAIVVQDRIVARRLRALLQRTQVQVADETGWKLSTTRAAAALTAWFDVVTTAAQNTMLLDFLKSPFQLEASGEGADIVMAIEVAMRRANIAGGWSAVTAAIPPGPAREHVEHLSIQASRFKQQRTIAVWMDVVNSVLAALGMAEAFRKDAAGQQMMALLQKMTRDCSALTQQFSFSEWRAFVSMQMETTTFVPPVTDKRVVMLPLNCLHLRSFDAVLVIGADAVHLPSLSGETLFFGNSVRKELGLATHESRQLQQLRDFAELVTANPIVVISWQCMRDGDPNPVSNWVERLDLALAVAALPPLAHHQPQLPQVRLHHLSLAMPGPAAPDLLPQKLSASGYGSLVACPYQFFATRMLGLSGLEEFSEGVEKRDYGDWLHQILNLFHAGVRDKAIGAEDPCAYLKCLTEEVFASELARSGAALGFYNRWIKAMPAYLEWAALREASGWTFVFGEQWQERDLVWTGGQITLHGRVDRVDSNEAGQTAVVDYKTTTLTELKKRIDNNEDHQLAFYGLLAQTAPVAAHFVSLEPLKNKIGDVAAPAYSVWQQQLRLQIGNTMQAITQGAPLLASGIDSTCQYCTVRGVCRKGAW